MLDAPSAKENALQSFGLDVSLAGCRRLWQMRLETG